MVHLSAELLEVLEMLESNLIHLDRIFQVLLSQFVNNYLVLSPFHKASARRKAAPSRAALIP